MSLNSMRQAFGHSAKWILGIVTVAMLVTAFTGLGFNIGGGRQAAAPTSSDDVIATVNGAPITRAEFDQQVQTEMTGMSQMGQSPSIVEKPVLENYVLTDLETTKLQVLAAKKFGLKATDADIAHEREKLIDESGIRQKLGLPATASADDVDAAYQKIAGHSLSDIWPDSDMEQVAILDKLNAYLNSKVVVTEQDVINADKQWHTQHILIARNGRSDAQAKVIAQQVLAKVQAPGANFAALAKQYSDDPGSKNKGGDDGWIDQSTQYVPEFKNAAFTLQAGQVTPQPVASAQFGYFIIKCEAVRENLPKDFAKNKQKYIDQLTQTKQQQAQQDFRTALMTPGSFKLVIKDPSLKGITEYVTANQSPAGPQQDAQYKAAIKDLAAGLNATGVGQDAALNYVTEAQAYAALRRIPQAIAAYQAALKDTDDPQVHLQLGALYAQNKQPTLALAEYAAASKSAWDDPNVHQTLVADYQQMGRKDLVAQESAWLTNYRKQQAAQQGGMPGMGGMGQPITIGAPPAASAKPAAATTGHVTSAGVKPAVASSGKVITVQAGKPISFSVNTGGAKPAAGTTAPAPSATSKPATQ